MSYTRDSKAYEDFKDAFDALKADAAEKEKEMEIRQTREEICNEFFGGLDIEQVIEACKEKFPESFV
jgi:hypothetical protein